MTAVNYFLVFASNENKMQLKWKKTNDVINEAMTRAPTAEAYVKLADAYLDKQKLYMIRLTTKIELANSCIADLKRNAKTVNSNLTMTRSVEQEYISAA